MKKGVRNREWKKVMVFGCEVLFWIVENLLRVYGVYYEYGYMIIDELKKKRIVLEGLKLLGCEGVERRECFYGVIWGVGIVIELVSGICKGVRGRSKFGRLVE